MEHFVRETASDLIAYFRDAHITKTDKTSRRMNFNPKGVVQLVSWMESLSCCAFLFLLLFIYLLPSRPQYPMAHPILHTIFLIRYVQALEEVFFPDRTCCPKDIGEKKKKKIIFTFCSRLCCSEWAKVLSLHLNTFIRKL